MTDEPASGAASPEEPGAAAWTAPDPDVVTQRLEDELIVVHLRTNRIFVLNQTGARFWELLTSGLARSEIEDRLLREFEIGENDLRGEVDDFVVALSSEELVSVDNAR